MVSLHEYLYVIESNIEIIYYLFQISQQLVTNEPYKSMQSNSSLIPIEDTSKCQHFMWKGYNCAKPSRNTHVILVRALETLVRQPESLVSRLGTLVRPVKTERSTFTYFTYRLKHLNKY